MPLIISQQGGKVKGAQPLLPKSWGEVHVAKNPAAEIVPSMGQTIVEVLSGCQD